MKKIIPIIIFLSITQITAIAQDKKGVDLSKNIHTYTDEELTKLSDYIKKLEARDSQGELTYKEEDLIKLSGYIKELEKKDSLLTILQSDFKRVESERNQLQEALAKTETRLKEMEATTSSNAGNNQLALAGGSAAANPANAFASRYNVQAGVFSTQSNAKKQVNRIKAINPKAVVTIEEEYINGKKLHRVVAGDFTNPEQAEAFRANLKSKGVDGIVRGANDSGSRVSKKEVHDKVLEVYGKIIRFDLNSASLHQSSTLVLDNIADMLKKENGNFVIEGHADITGPADWNQELSENRASTIKDYLVSKGIEGSRLKTKGYGSSRPLHSNNTEEGRAKNRVVVIKPVK